MIQLPVQWNRVSAVLALSGAMDNGIPWHRAVYFAQWSNGGQNIVKKSFNGKGAMRYNTEAQYADY